MSFYQRFEECRPSGATDNAFCRAAGIEWRQFLDIKQGSIPMVRSIIRMARNLNYDVAWLTYGAPYKKGAFKEVECAFDRKKAS